MKVKDLIKALETFNPEAYIITSEYTGCSNSIKEITEVITVRKGIVVPRWDDSTYTKIIRSNGIAKEDCIYLSCKEE